MDGFEVAFRVWFWVGVVVAGDPVRDGVEEWILFTNGVDEGIGGVCDDAVIDVFFSESVE